MEDNLFQTRNRRRKSVTSVPIKVLLMTAPPVHVARCEASKVLHILFQCVHNTFNSKHIDLSTITVLILNTKERKCHSIATVYVMTNFIWLHVSTHNESFSGHLSLLL
jgi:hypothetical protein